MNLLRTFSPLLSAVSLLAICASPSEARSSLMVDLSAATADVDLSGASAHNAVLIPVPSLANGFTFHATFTPVTADLSGTVGIVEVGGNANGSGLYLIDGVLTFVTKQTGNAATFPSSFNDTDLGGGATDPGGRVAAVQHSSGILTAGQEYSVAVVYDPPNTNSGTPGTGTANVQLGLRAGGTEIEYFTLTNTSSNRSWSGNRTYTAFSSPVNGGGLTNTAGGTIWREQDVNSLAGTTGRNLYWNQVGTIIVPEPTTVLGLFGLVTVAFLRRNRRSLEMA